MSTKYTCPVCDPDVSVKDALDMVAALPNQSELSDDETRITSCCKCGSVWYVNNEKKTQYCLVQFD